MKHSGATWDHDCDACKFLGTFIKKEAGPEKIIDIYWCDQGKEDMPSLTSVLGRYGSDGPEYISSHPPAAFGGERHLEFMRKHSAHGAWYLKALDLAAERGLYDHRTMTAILKKE